MSAGPPGRWPKVTQKIVNLDGPPVFQMSLLNTFMMLASATTPVGSEPHLWNQIPKGDQHKTDEKNNLQVLVRKADGSLPTTMFSCHLDGATTDCEPVGFRLVDDRWIFAMGDTILGADDKLGAALLIKMIWARVPGLYVFHGGEESGCIGSRWLSANPDQLLVPVETLKRCIALDRKGTTSVVTKQGSCRTCSDAFALDLSDRLNAHSGFEYKPDPGGLYTDSKHYAHLIPECTNLSIGYWDHHTTNEHWDLPFAQSLLGVLMGIDWESLTTEREPQAPVYEGWTGGYRGSTGVYKKSAADDWVPGSTEKGSFPIWEDDLYKGWHGSELDSIPLSLEDDPADETSVDIVCPRCDSTQTMDAGAFLRHPADQDVRCETCNAFAPLWEWDAA